MNKLYNIGVVQNDFKLGKITIIGGETEELTKLTHESIIPLIPEKTNSKKEIKEFERKIENISIQELKELNKTLVEQVKRFDLARRNERNWTRHCSINDYKVLNTFDKTIIGKQKCLSFIITKRKMPMIKRKTAYEVKKGDKMMNERSTKMYEKQVSVFEKDGELKNQDLLALYFSGRIGKNRGGKFCPLIGEGLMYEKICPSIRVMMEHHLPLFVEIRGEFRSIYEIKRRVFSTTDEEKDSVSFLLNLKGEATRLTESKYYNSEEEEWKELMALSYNSLDYEKNEIVVLAREETLNHIENRLNKLHEEFYDFKNKEGERITGLRGLKEYERKTLKQIKKPKNGFDESEIDDLFEIFKERRADGKLVINGAQSIRNIEHDIRNHEYSRYLLSKSSDELFFLKTALEDAKIIFEDMLPEEEKEEYLNSKKVESYIAKHYEHLTMKKVTALINVVSGLHLRYEDEEDLGKYLSDELDEIDKVAKERSGSDSSYKTHRNYYSQKEGVLAPNGDPQKTHRRKSNPPSMSRIRNLRKEHRRNVLKGKYAGVSNPEVLSSIYSGPGELSFLGEIMNFDKEYERVFGVKTPTPSTSFRPYPWYRIHDILGTDEQDKEVLKGVFSEVSGYLSEQDRDFIRDRLYFDEPEYPAPQFRVPNWKNEKNKNICDFCQKRYECFLEVTRRMRDKLSSPKPLDIIRTDFDLNKNRMAYEAVTIKKSPCKNLYGLDSYELEIAYRLGYLSKEQEEMYLREKEEREKTFYYEGIPNWFFKDELFSKLKMIKRAEQSAPKIIPHRVWKGKTPFTEYKVEYPENYSKVVQISHNMYKVIKKGFVFYAKGNLSALDYESVSIAGIREPSSETKTFVTNVIEDLSQEYVIVSGLAKGCDKTAHEVCLDNDGITIAVLPSGFNHLNNNTLANRILENDGLLISEYPPETKINKGRYLERNKIIAGLSKTVILCEAGEGTKNTFRHARRMKKNILAQRIDTENNNSFFESGAKVYGRDRIE